MDKELPLKRNRQYTEQINVKVDPLMKNDEKILKESGVDTAEYIRQLVRDGFEKAKLKLNADTF